MTEEEKQKYLDMVERAFDSKGRITPDGRVFMAAMMFNIDEHSESMNKVRDVIRSIVRVLTND